MPNATDDLRRIADLSGRFMTVLAPWAAVMAYFMLMREIERPAGAMRVVGILGASLMLASIPLSVFMTGRALRRAAGGSVEGVGRRDEVGGGAEV